MQFRDIGGCNSLSAVRGSQLRTLTFALAAFSILCGSISRANAVAPSQPLNLTKDAVAGTASKDWMMLFFWQRLGTLWHFLQGIGILPSDAVKAIQQTSATYQQTGFPSGMSGSDKTACLAAIADLLDFVSTPPPELDSATVTELGDILKSMQSDLGG